MTNYTDWKEGTKDELRFWNEFLSEYSGRKIGTDLNECTSINQQDILECVKACKGTVKVLDVGSGATSFLSAVTWGRKVIITATDALAGDYTKMIKKYHVERDVVPVRALFESLTDVVGVEKFDFVHCSNALDHSFDALKGLHEMLRSLKKGRYAYIKHHRDVAVLNNHVGLHQWDFNTDGVNFLIDGQPVDLSMYSDYSVRIDGNFIILCIKK